MDNKYKFLYGGNDYAYYYLQSQQFIIADGITISFYAANGDHYDSVWCLADKNETNGNRRYMRSCGELFVDINGYLPPNLVSKDLFHFFIYRDGIVPVGLLADGVWTVNFEQICLGKRYTKRDTCAGWVLTMSNCRTQYCRE